jgi:hypothetical protein
MVDDLAASARQRPQRSVSGTEPSQATTWMRERKPMQRDPVSRQSRNASVPSQLPRVGRLGPEHVDHERRMAALAMSRTSIARSSSNGEVPDHRARRRAAAPGQVRST